MEKIEREGKQKRTAEVVHGQEKSDWVQIIKEKNREILTLIKENICSSGMNYGVSEH